MGLLIKTQHKLQMGKKQYLKKHSDKIIQPETKNGNGIKSLNSDFLIPLYLQH